MQACKGNRNFTMRADWRR